MTDSRTGMALVLTIVGRFLYKLCLAIAIVWVIGIVVGAIIGHHSGGGATVTNVTP